MTTRERMLFALADLLDADKITEGQRLRWLLEFLRKMLEEPLTFTTIKDGDRAIITIPRDWGEDDIDRLQGALSERFPDTSYVLILDERVDVTTIEKEANGVEG